jgi:hypothetical protein
MLTFGIYMLTFEIYRPTFEIYKPTFGVYRPTFGVYRPTFGQGIHISIRSIDRVETLSLDISSLRESATLWLS